jgi:hypothetical protein
VLLVDSVVTQHSSFKLSARRRAPYDNICRAKGELCAVAQPASLLVRPSTVSSGTQFAWNYFVIAEVVCETRQL